MPRWFFLHGRRIEVRVRQLLSVVLPSRQAMNASTVVRASILPCFELLSPVRGRKERWRRRSAVLCTAAAALRTNGTSGSAEEHRHQPCALSGRAVALHTDGRSGGAGHRTMRRRGHRETNDEHYF
jgi:hypothetical protein